MSFSSFVEQPLRTAWTVGGEVRETLFWACTSGAARAVVLMIPGSPGVADFYIDFCSAVHAQFAEHMDIVCVSHLGHTRFHDNHGTVHHAGQTHSLADQLANLLVVFDEIDAEYRRLDPPPQMLLCAHSVGCYFAQRLVELRPDRIDRVFGLFPAIDRIADTPRGRQLAPLFRPALRWVASGTVDVLRWLLPTGAICALAATADSLDRHSARLVVEKFLHGPCVHSVLAMAADELRVIGDLDENLYRTHGHKFVLYYGADDGWVPDACRRRMLDTNTQVRVVSCERGISHAFVSVHSADMADIVVAMLAEQLAGTGCQPTHSGD
ncbi:hypothetical protein IWQ57_000629 [Coemansia nantahalensis]|uniref:Uncharacterized protein n=1 Tax=Coemansia nantahalensis TaxID=2789366 RepID=A0ACC1K6Y4_9FUNG|nr:hypothetical protein IWQ57_000629 [Coemansia nantahalensis]